MARAGSETFTGLSTAYQTVKAAGGRYVYVLWRFDKGEPEPFYVGVGKGKRILQHGSSSERARNPIKAKILAKCGEIACTLAAVGVSEAVAFHVEQSLIAEHGRIDLGTGTLSNLTRGGEGGGGAKPGAGNSMARAVRADGDRYDTVLSAAEALGVSHPAIIYRINSGWPGYHYEGEEQQAYVADRKGRCRAAKLAQCKTVTVDGVSYRGVREAGRSLGIQSVQVRMRCQSDRWPGYEMEA